MRMKTFTIIWIFIFLILGFEYLSLNYKPSLSLLLFLQQKNIIHHEFRITPEPGRPLSLWLGWLGLSLMVLMNVYSMRKRFTSLHKWGRLSHWLNFHVFCGLLGPTLILFHCNLKVRGIVAISFWSMVISFSSGIIGRYFYVQLLKAKVELENEFEKKITTHKNYLTKKNIITSEDEINQQITNALVFVGGPTKQVQNSEIDINPFIALIKSTIGDIKLFYSKPAVPNTWPPSTTLLITDIAIHKRRALFLEPFQSLMGYWHTLHFPFAIFMYVAAFIHVVAALVFGI